MASFVHSSSVRLGVKILGSCGVLAFCVPSALHVVLVIVENLLMGFRSLRDQNRDIFVMIYEEELCTRDFQLLTHANETMKLTFLK